MKAEGRPHLTLSPDPFSEGESVKEWNMGFISSVALSPGRAG